MSLDLKSSRSQTKSNRSCQLATPTSFGKAPYSAASPFTSIISTSRLSISCMARPAMPWRSPYKPRGGIEHAAELLLALGPQPHHGLALAIEVGLHVGEFFDDGVDAVTEAGAGQVGVHHLHLGLLAFLRLAAGGDVDQRLPECDGERDREAGLRDPDVVNEVEGLDFLGQRGRNDQRDLRLGGALVIAQLAQASRRSSSCVRLDSQRMVPQRWPPGPSTRCTTSPPNSPLATGSIRSRGKRLRSRDSSSISSASPCSCCEPWSALRRSSSIWRCMPAIWASFSVTLDLSASSASSLALSRTAPRFCLHLLLDGELDLALGVFELALLAQHIGLGLLGFGELRVVRGQHLLQFRKLPVPLAEIIRQRQTGLLCLGFGDGGAFGPQLSRDLFVEALARLGEVVLRLLEAGPHDGRNRLPWPQAAPRTACGPRRRSGPPAIWSA